jgi:Tol biopolymer transport system component
MMRTVSVPRVALLAILALGMVAAPEQGSAVRPGGNGKIAFASARDQNFEIYSIYPDATGTERLTTDPASDSDPAWSPEGRRIAFKSNRAGNDDIWRMAEDGTGLVQLTTDAARDDNPTWSAGGRNIAFVSTRDGDAEIFAMNEDGTGQDQLTRNDVVDATPAWSPDDSRIAFRSERDGNSEIYVMNVDGTGVTRLTNNPAVDVGPSWSDDGTQIAFASLRDGNWEIYVMDSDGSDPVRLTRNLDVDLDPSWSPDGNLLAFTSDRDGNNEIYEMNADGSGQARLTTNAGEDTTPDWQWTAVELPKPQPLSDAGFSGRWKESEYLGAVVVTGVAPRQLGLRFELRRGPKTVLVKTLVVHAGDFRRRLAVPRTVLPGRYVLDVKQVSGPIVVRPQQERLSLIAPPEGVVSRAWASTTIAGPPLRILPRTSDAYANFRFEVLPRPGRPIVARWNWKGAPLGTPRRKERSVIVVAGIYVVDGFLPRGEYTCVLSAGNAVVRRVTFRIS